MNKLNILIKQRESMKPTINIIKQIFVLFFLIIISMPNVYAKDKNEKVYKKLIEELDIDSTAKSAPSTDEFWNAIWLENAAIYKFTNALEKKKSSAEEAINRVCKAQELFNIELSSLNIIADNSDSLIVALIDKVGFTKVYPKIKLYVINSEEANAFSTPDGKIYLSNGLFYDEIQYPHIIGILAHEFAHFILQHVRISAYETIKQEKLNKTIAGISSAVNVAANAYAATNGVNVNWDDVYKNTKDLFDEAALQAGKFRYKYNRKQEIEADIIAFRFLDYLGYGGEKYIETLEIIDKNQNYPKYINEDSDHPTTSFRISLLKYMRQHPEIIREKPKKTLNNQHKYNMNNK